jgi:hypothetical protein
MVINDSGFWLSKEKDNFHTLIFGIDKMVTFGTVYSTIVIKLSVSKGGD